MESLRLWCLLIVVCLGVVVVTLSAGGASAASVASLLDGCSSTPLVDLTHMAPLPASVQRRLLSDAFTSESGLLASLHALEVNAAQGSSCEGLLH